MCVETVEGGCRVRRERRDLAQSREWLGASMAEYPMEDRVDTGRKDSDKNYGDRQTSDD